MGCLEFLLFLIPSSAEYLSSSKPMTAILSRVQAYCYKKTEPAMRTMAMQLCRLLHATCPETFCQQFQQLSLQTRRKLKPVLIEVIPDLDEELGLQKRQRNQSMTVLPTAARAVAANDDLLEEADEDLDFDADFGHDILESFEAVNTTRRHSVGASLRRQSGGDSLRRQSSGKPLAQAHTERRQSTGHALAKTPGKSVSAKTPKRKPLSTISNNAPNKIPGPMEMGVKKGKATSVASDSPVLKYAYAPAPAPTPTFAPEASTLQSILSELSESPSPAALQALSEACQVMPEAALVAQVDAILGPISALVEAPGEMQQQALAIADGVCHRAAKLPPAVRHDLLESSNVLVLTNALLGLYTSAPKYMLTTAEHCLGCLVTLVAAVPEDLLVLLLSLVAREASETSDLQLQATLKTLTNLVTAIPVRGLHQHLQLIVQGLVLCMQSKKAIVRKGVVEVFVASYAVVGDALDPFLADIHVVQRRLINIYITKFKATQNAGHELRLVA